MQGKTVVLILVGAAVIFAAALWYFQNHAYYEDVVSSPVEIDGRTYAPADWQGISASSSPLKARSCFRLDPEVAGRILIERKSETGAEPLVAPYWFDCFDAAALSRDLSDGNAVAILLGPTSSDGIDAWLALYPDGRAYGWRQVNAKYAK